MPVLVARTLFRHAAIVTPMVCAMLVWAPDAPGEESSRTVTELPLARFDLHYTAPVECPREETFLGWTNQFYAGQSERARSSWLASDDEQAGSIRVKIIARGTDYVAHLVMVTADGRCSNAQPVHTEITCADAVRATAYSLAEALRGPLCQDRSAQPATLACPASSAATQRATEERPNAAALEVRRKSLRGEIGLGGGGVGRVAEDIAWGGQIFAGFRSEAAGMSGRVATGYWYAGRLPVGYRLRAQMWSLGLSFCPYEIGLQPVVTIPLCATGEFGQVAISGFGTAAPGGAPADPDATTASDGDHANIYPWGALGIAPRLRFSMLWLFAEIEPNLSFPLLRHPMYTHQPGRATSERELTGQVGPWLVLKALVNVGLEFR